MRPFRGEFIVDAKKDGFHAERSLVLAARSSKRFTPESRRVSSQCGNSTKEVRAKDEVYVNFDPASTLHAGRTNFNEPHGGCFLASGISP